MKKNTLILMVAVFVVGSVGLMFAQKIGTANDPAGSIAATIYKSATCGCCGVYVSYMRREGYDVDAKNVADLSAVKREQGVPYELESCHTTEVGGYVVEGHVPTEAMQTLLAEKPDIKGIGMPGMPMGSPGMGGVKNGPFVIHEILHDGTVGEVFMTL